MPLEFRFPDVGEGIDAGELIEWYVSEGQVVREDEPMADVQTDKATVTIPCPTSGRVLELRVKVGELVPVGTVMAVFEPERAAEPPAVSSGSAHAATPKPPRAAPAATPKAPLASPAVRKRASELGIDLAAVEGSGPGGRIELEDLGHPGSPARLVPLRGVRRTIARTMTEAWRTIPHIIDYREVDATALIRWRDQMRDRADGERLRRALTITPLLVRVAAEGLRRHPCVNASIDMEREEIALHGEYNIGIATAAPDGLLVPVVRNADAKQLFDLALEVAELTTAARERRLRPEQLAGGTFTLNNYGPLGVWLGTPIIKPGEVANLGVGRVQDRPVALDGQVAVRPIVTLAVAGDHRVLDGHTLGAFVSDVVAMIEDPAPVIGTS
ncbi:MAG: 2-oxo acid dehydrogenase subunit E2 [Actinobacteria bacterium]|nr:MAG: 2-oxo acid dehydrogenase subunit E2 [Actinomycetota bacterium]